MRLLNTRTIALEDVGHDESPVYAILSHRWADSEVSFQDIQNLEVARTRKGFQKIKSACKQGQQDKYNYIWVDTCCINKESSAELSESINSMFRWYKHAAVCYAYLADVYGGPQHEEIGRLIAAIEWFDRGWTLQELIAPDNVTFFNHEWVELGTKLMLSGLLKRRTRINAPLLAGTDSISKYSIAARMSWASQRKTTPIEDSAYCLLGIFDVNMPALYGEGKRAFIRLQEEIIKNSDDHSIFAWPFDPDDCGTHGLLADSPTAFRDCREIETIESRPHHGSYKMTNRGLSIKLETLPCCPDTYFARLDCANESDVQSVWNADQAARIWIVLRRLYQDDQFVRVSYKGNSVLKKDTPIPSADTTRKFCVPQRLNEALLAWITRPQFGSDFCIFSDLFHSASNYNLTASQERVSGFGLAALSDHKLDGDHMWDGDFKWDRDLRNTYISFPLGLEWDETDRKGWIERAHDANGDEILEINFQIDDRPWFHLRPKAKDVKIKSLGFGFDREWNPVCFITTQNAVETLNHEERLDFELSILDLWKPGSKVWVSKPDRDLQK